MVLGLGDLAPWLVTKLNLPFPLLFKWQVVLWSCYDTAQYVFLGYAAACILCHILGRLQQCQFGVCPDPMDISVMMLLLLPLAPPSPPISHQYNK